MIFDLYKLNVLFLKTLITVFIVKIYILIAYITFPSKKVMILPCQQKTTITNPNGYHVTQYSVLHVTLSGDKHR